MPVVEEEEVAMVVGVVEELQLVQRPVRLIVVVEEIKEILELRDLQLVEDQLQ